MLPSLEGLLLRRRQRRRSEGSKTNTPSLFRLVPFAREQRKNPTRSEALLWDVRAAVERIRAALGPWR